MAKPTPVASAEEAAAEAPGGRGGGRERRRRGLRRGGRGARQAQGRRAWPPQGQQGRRRPRRRWAEQAPHGGRGAGALPLPHILGDHEGSRRPRLRPGTYLTTLPCLPLPPPHGGLKLFVRDAEHAEEGGGSSRGARGKEREAGAAGARTGQRAPAAAAHEILH